MKEWIRSSQNVNTLWARVLVDELARNDVRYAIVSPGSRSTPLAIAVHQHPDISAIPVIDERSAAFFALGIAKECGIPPVLICTSGTAAAHYLPAVCEADASGIPFIALTADRPLASQDAAAPQTMRQDGMYGRYVRWNCNLPAASVDEDLLRSLRSSVCYGVAQARTGPVHINVPFEKPLEPSPATEGRAAIPNAARPLFREGAFGREDGRAFTRWTQSRILPDSADLEELAQDLAASRRPLIIAGPDGGSYAGAIAEYVSAAGIPCLAAEAASGLRFRELPDGVAALAPLDLLIESQWLSRYLTPDLVILVGGVPTATKTQEFLDALGNVPQVQITPDGKRIDPAHRSHRHLAGDPGMIFTELRALLEAYPISSLDGDWYDGLIEASAVVSSAVSKALEQSDALMEPHIYANIIDALPEGTPLMVSSSMPIRDLERFAMPTRKSIDVFCNRGVNGIDGITSTAFGIARARKQNVVLITGDIAFLHDFNALNIARTGDINATIIIVNNDGGEIFSMLPVSEFEPPFTELFTTPHGLRFKHACEFFGLEHFAVKTLYQFENLVRSSSESPGVQVIEVQSGIAAEKDFRSKIRTAVYDAAEAWSAAAPYSTPVQDEPLHQLTLRKEANGDGTPALLLHGFTRSGTSWKNAITALKHERPLYTADLIGHGSAPTPEFGDDWEVYTIEYNAERLHESLLRAGDPKLHLAGYSMGGRTALYYALTYPERIGSLTLISASPGIEDAEARHGRERSDGEMARRIIQDGLEPFVDSWSSSDLIGSGMEQAAASRLNAHRERMTQRAMGLQGSLLGMGQGVQPNLWKRLGELRMPVLLVLGDCDTKYVDIMTAMSERIPDALLHTFEGAGHDVPGARPAELAAVLRKFWNDIEE